MKKIKEFFVNVFNKTKEFLFKYKKHLAVVCLCLSFLGLGTCIGSKVASASGIDVPITGQTLSVVYSDIPTPVFNGKMYSNNDVYTIKRLYGSFSLLFEIDYTNDRVVEISVNDGLIFDNNVTYSTSIPLKYWDSIVNTEETYGFYLDLIDYNLPTTAGIEGGAIDLIYNSNLAITYTVNNGRSAVITYEWTDAEDLYYLDFQISYDGAYEFVNIYEQKFDYYVYDFSASYMTAYDTGYREGYTEGAEQGYQDGYDVGAEQGYQNAINDGSSGGVFGGIITAVNDFLDIQLIGNVTISNVLQIGFGIILLGFVIKIFLGG